MEFVAGSLPGVYVIKPRMFRDARGYFFSPYNESVFRQAGIQYPFMQDNQSESEYGVVRGLHFQVQPWAQTKLVRVLHGRIFDVVLDIRPDSPTFGKWMGEELSDENNLQMLVPRGFAHGFSVLSARAVVLYKIDNEYRPDMERGIMYNDGHLNIDWRIPAHEMILSDKDQNHPDFKTYFNL